MSGLNKSLSLNGRGFGEGVASASAGKCAFGAERVSYCHAGGNTPIPDPSPIEGEGG